ncbi:hypothetical protein HDV62DRAFT_28484 [Trichoderma sp. SZMC 28011]
MLLTTGARRSNGRGPCRLIALLFACCLCLLLVAAEIVGTGLSIHWESRLTFLLSGGGVWKYTCTCNCTVGRMGVKGGVGSARVLVWK